MRFRFGRNWQSFLQDVDEEAVGRAEQDLIEMLDGDIAGRTFLDIGSGSGLSSVAATRLGAQVHAFDDDEDSVAASATLRDASGQSWPLERGDVLDSRYLTSLGHFDIVYSWGVLHHTGGMWQACENAATRVAPQGRLFIALYNDQGWQSRVWWAVKWGYNASPVLRPLALALTFVVTWSGKSIKGLQQGRSPRSVWTTYKQQRGMSPWRDVVDWAGGFPFEVASPAAVEAFYTQRGFALERKREVGNRLGCNQFVFRRVS
jgi:2-polyprenyl-3-methyl-5-hydroxy-6-metoxy-1,4-benzoquinol methylase